MKMLDTRRKSLSGAVLSLVVPFLAVGLSTPAQGQEVALDIQRFTPSPGGNLNFNHVEGAGVLGHLKPTFGFYLNYAARPLVAKTSTQTIDLVSADVGLDVLAGIGIGKRFQLGLALPVTVLQTTGTSDTFDVPQVAAQTLGDLRIVPKLKLLGEDRAGVSLSVPITVPTGDPAAYHGEAGVTVEPRLIGELALGEKLALGANVGYLVRTPQSSLGLEVGSELKLSAGLAYRAVPDRLTLLLEAFGGAAFGATSNDEPAASPLEANLAARLHLGQSHSITLGGGPGIIPGFGTPTYRVLLGYAFNVGATPPPPPDRDGDGILDAVDVCPNEAEDKDNYKEEDGCPDPDNDADGILDTSDKCPFEPEDKDNFEDADGCPDPDNDADGVLDADDKCPAEKEDRDSFQDGDGCIDPDNDGDGILDAADACPNEAEDKDQLGDEDGCPEKDHDKDGILDVDDQCPRKPETINGNKDEDGCPDEGKVKVIVGATQIEILEKVYFATNKPDILPRSIPILKQVVAVLKANEQITRVIIEGHTDAQGSDEYNMNLSQARVDSVMKLLVERGIDPKRLSATGYGETRPVAPNTTAPGRARNRRVEFNIVEINGQPVAPTTQTPPTSPKP